MDRFTQADPAMIRQILEHTASEAITRARNYEFPRHVPEAFEGPAHAVEGAFVGVIPILKRAFIRLAQGLVLLLSSMSMYAIFYFLVMPGHHATEVLYFDYSGMKERPAQVCENVAIGPTIAHMTTESTFPWAVADLFTRHSQWEAFHDGVVPKPLTESRILGKRTSYYIDVALELPESDINRENGMFGVTVDLLSSDGTSLATSIRSARLPQESHWIAVIRKAVWLVPLLLGVVDECVTVLVPSYRHFVESPDKPLRYVVVKLMEHMTTYKTGAEPIEVTRGEVRIGKELSKLQMLLKEWFYTCFCVGVTTLFFGQLLGIICIGLVKDVYERRRMQDDASIALDGAGSFGGSHDGRANGRSPTQAQDEWEDLPLPPESDLPPDPGAFSPPVGDTAGDPPTADSTSEPLGRPEDVAEEEPTFPPPTPNLSAEFS